MALNYIVMSLVISLAYAVPHEELDELDMLEYQGRLVEYAKALGLKDVNLVIPNKDYTKGRMLTNVSPLGDILLPELHMDEDARQGLNFDKSTGSRWPNGEIPYVISLNFNSNQRDMITNAIEAFNNRVSNIKIRPSSRSDKDYVRVINGNGCYSYLGKTGGAQPLSLQKNGCLYDGTVQHEFLHAAGFTHEQNRPDRDEYVTILWDNIPPEWQSQYEKGSSEDYGIHGPYDPYSLMHYSYLAPVTDKPAFEFKQKNVDVDKVGNSDAPTDIDVQKIDKLYS